MHADLQLVTRLAFLQLNRHNRSRSVIVGRCLVKLLRLFGAENVCYRQAKQRLGSHPEHRGSIRARHRDGQVWLGQRQQRAV